MAVMTLDKAELEQCRDCRNDCRLKHTCGLVGSGCSFTSSQTWWTSYYSSRESHEKLTENDLIESCQADGTTQQKECQTSVEMCSVAYTGSATFTEVPLWVDQSISPQHLSSPHHSGVIGGILFQNSLLCYGKYTSRLVYSREYRINNINIHFIWCLWKHWH